MQTQRTRDRFESAGDADLLEAPEDVAAAAAALERGEAGGGALSELFEAEAEAEAAADAAAVDTAAALAAVAPLAGVLPVPVGAAVAFASAAGLADSGCMRSICTTLTNRAHLRWKRFGQVD